MTRKDEFSLGNDKTEGRGSRQHRWVDGKAWGKEKRFEFLVIGAYKACTCTDLWHFSAATRVERTQNSDEAGPRGCWAA